MLGTVGHFLTGLGSDASLNQYSPQGTGYPFSQTRATLTAAQAARSTGRAFLRSPGPTTAHTAEGLGALALGTIAAPFQIGYDTAAGAVHGDPLRGVRQDVVNAAARDLSRRYGPLYRGEKGASEQFTKRVIKEGATSELVDAATVLAPQAAVSGRALGNLARAGKLGERTARFASDARPLKRVSGNLAVPQELSPNLFRAAGQRGEDRVRRAAQAKRERAPGKPRGLQPRPGEVVKTIVSGQRRAQKKETARMSARSYNAFQREMAAEVHGKGGAVANVAGLSRHQQQAVFHAVQGLVSPGDPARAVEQLGARAEQVRAGLAERYTGAELQRRLVSNPELKTIAHLQQHAGEVFGPKLEAFVRAEAVRNARLSASNVHGHPLTLEARVLRPQALALGVADPTERAAQVVEHTRERVQRAKADLTDAQAKHDRIAGGLAKGQAPLDPGAFQAARARLVQANRDLRQARADYRTARRAHTHDTQAFMAETRAAAQAAGLPEPAGYVKHFGQPADQQLTRSEFARGKGGQANLPPKMSRLALLRRGEARTGADTYIHSVAQQVKYRHNWAHVANQYERHRIPLDAETIRAVVARRGATSRNLTLHEAKQVADAMGLHPEDVAFGNPRVLRSEAAKLEDSGTGALHGEEDAQVAARSLVSADSRSAFENTRGWQALPKAVHDELHAQANPSGAAGRLADKAQGLQSRVLLGSSPAWALYQVASNAFLAAFGVHGKLDAAVRAPAWFRDLPKETRDYALDTFGSGVARAHGGRVHIGAAADGHRLLETARFIAASPFFQRAKRFDPFDQVFALDDAQNTYFRKTVLYDRVRREAFRDMQAKSGRLFANQQRIAAIFGKEPREQMAAILRNPERLDQMLRDTIDLMGDYTTYTQGERRSLKRFAMFYGYLRYSLRLAFYVMPIKHPLMGALIAQLAKLHNQEVTDLLGGREAPWAYSRLFIPHNGQLRSIDFGRANVLTNQVTQIPTEGLQSIGGLMSPLGAAVADQVYSRRLYFGRGFRVRGSFKEATHIPWSDPVRMRILFNDLLTLAAPARILEKANAGGHTIGDESLPWDVKPLQPSGPQAMLKERKKVERAPKGAGLLLQQLATPFVPEPDYTRETVKARQQKAKQDALRARLKKSPPPGGWW